MVTYQAVGTVSNPVDYSGLGYVPTAILHASTNSPVPYVEYITFNNSVAPSSSTATAAYYNGTALDMSVSIVIDGAYLYSISTPSSSDEIDLSGTDIEMFKRGPTTYGNFSPNPPFSHVDFEGTTSSDQLSTAVISAGSPFTANGISDAQTSGAGYYYIGATLTSVQQVPEPADLFPVSLLAAIGVFALSRRIKPRRIQG